MKRLVLLAAVVVLASACGSSTSAPKEGPTPAAERFLGLIVHNRYTEAWDDLHPADQKVAPRAEYVGCESRSPVLAAPRTVRPVGVTDESVGLGDGTFVDAKAVALRLDFAGGFHLVHTVHVIASHGKWRWILPAPRFRAYRDDKCPVDAGSGPPSSAS